MVHKLLHLATAFSETRGRIGAELPLCSPQHMQIGSMLGTTGKHEHLLAQGQAKQIVADEKKERNRLLPLCGEVDHLLGQMFEGVQVAKRSSCLHHVGRQVSVFLCMGEGWGILVGTEGRRGTCREVRRGLLWSQQEKELPQEHLALAVSWITLDPITYWLLYCIISISQSAWALC